jgi:hypothetical protein
MGKDDQPDLQVMMGRAMEVYTLFIALQEAGFNEMQALALMQPLIITGALKKSESP